MGMIRMNITIPEDLARKMEELVGLGKKSNFIAESLRERIRKIESAELQKKLVEGYQARREESLSIAKEFEPVDLEGWDEY